MKRILLIAVAALALGASAAQAQIYNRQGYTTFNSNGTWSRTEINPFGGGATTFNNNGTWSYQTPPCCNGPAFQGQPAPRMNRYQ